MASSFTPNINLEKPGIGEQDNEWGTTLNNNFDTIDTKLAIKDEDNMASDSASHLATQQSIKAYVDSQSASSLAADNITTGDAAVSIATTSGNITIDAQANDADVIIKVDDAGAPVTAVTFDGSDGGTASFSHDVKLANDGAVLGFGSGNDVTLTHVHDSGLTLSAGTNATALNLTSTNDSANVGPTINLIRDSANPAASDSLGYLNFVGEDEDSNQTNYAQIIAVITDETSGSEDGKLSFYTVTGGTNTLSLDLSSTALTVSNDIELASDAAELKFGADSDVLLTHVADTGLTMSVTGNNVAQFTVSQDKDTSGTGPVFNLTRYSGSPDDGDGGGIIQFNMENTNNELFNAAQIFAVATDVSHDGDQEDGKLIINTMKAGTATANLTVSNAGIEVANGGTIGSASDTDAIAIASSGVVTMNQIPVFSAGINVSGGTIAGTLATAAQTNITSLGTLSSLVVTTDTTGSALAVTQSGTGTGVYSQVNAGTNPGTFGYQNSSTAGNIAARGYSANGIGVYGSTGHASYAGVMGFASDASHYGYLGVGTIGVYATSVYCAGALYAASANAAVKSFRIPHGLREGHDLVHSSIEGPQYDLIYRGKVELVNGQASIEIDSHYNMTSGTFEWLTKSDSVQTFTSNETGWDAVKSSFSGNTITIECQNSSSTDTISWMVIAERGDPSVIEGEGTDDEGNLIIEPLSELEIELPPVVLPPTEPS